MSTGNEIIRCKDDGYTRKEGGEGDESCHTHCPFMSKKLKFRLMELSKT